MPRRSVFGIAAGVLLAAGLQGSASPKPPAGYLASFAWRDDQPRFGGFSAIEMRDATRFVALSDRGAFVEGTLTRDAQGVITGATTGRITLLTTDGVKPLSVPRSDSEGLALAPDGRFYVSFETAARVLQYDVLTGAARNLPTPEAFRRFPRNAGFESVAVGGDGAVYVIPERTAPAKGGVFSRYSGTEDEPDFPVFRFRNGVWEQPFDLPRSGAYLPVSADIGPDGRLYVLERAFHGLAGFGSRVRSFAMTSTALTQPVTLLESPVGLHDNLEGMSVWQDDSGALRLTLIADDNFRMFQRTEIVEYRFAQGS
ncbi:MAG: esterase-like activity of phytase family protein [Pseudomonadota bacterium]